MRQKQKQELKRYATDKKFVDVLNNDIGQHYVFFFFLFSLCKDTALLTDLSFLKKDCFAKQIKRVLDNKELIKK